MYIIICKSYKKKNYDVKKSQQVEIALVCVPIQIFIFIRIAVVLSKIFNKLVLVLTMYSGYMCIALQI